MAGWAASGALDDSGVLAGLGKMAEGCANEGLNSAMLERSMALDRELHGDALNKDQALHEDAKGHDETLLEKAFARDRLLHAQAVLTDLREHDKEADRDLWEQRTERFQTLMTISSLLFGACVALAVEGKLPADPGEIALELHEWAWRDPDGGPGEIAVELAALHYGLLGAGLGVNVCVVLGCGASAALRRPMDERLRGQA